MFVVGRRLFDLTDGWGGRHPFDKPIVVVTHSVPQHWVAAHPGAPFTFVADGLPWAHIDIAGPSYNTGSAWGCTPKGGTGVPVRTLLATIEGLIAD